MIAALPFIVAAVAQSSACLPVSGEKIYARDLVPAIPQYAAMPANLFMGYSPLAGVPRLENRAVDHGLLQRQDGD